MISENHQDNIPTLTDIIQPGDESMRNHFDASVFDDEINSSDEETELLNNDELKETLDTLIQQAMAETLPAIEAQLKETLTEKILQKLSKN
ncbi:MAG: hypothetical protein OQK76_08735 [Gammaproteobacteria bacterium]|nr:hypothetical protein [Gammaproteobacteria bacterium]MCW8910686.1 hypothetical protein [Gammaproteobacteria bacterium]